MEYKQTVKPDRSFKEDPYLEQKILSASPEQLVAYIYDAAIAGCIKRDFDKTSSALQVLIQSLKFDEKDEKKETKELSIRFYKTYDYLLDLLRKKEFDKVLKYIKEIRSTWVKAMKVY